MADDDEPGGTPACFLDEVDPAYAGYLTEVELCAFLATLLARERAAHALAARLSADADAFAEIEALIVRELGHRPSAGAGGVDPRFAGSTDSAALAALEAELIAMLETTLPRIAPDALHSALNRALAAHRARRAGHAAG